MQPFKKIEGDAGESQEIYRRAFEEVIGEIPKEISYEFLNNS